MGSRGGYHGCPMGRIPKPPGPQGTLGPLGPLGLLGPWASWTPGPHGTPGNPGVRGHGVDLAGVAFMIPELSGRQPLSS